MRIRWREVSFGLFDPRVFDVLTVFEAGRLGLPDEAQLEFAASAGRTMYTSNIRDYVRLHDRWQRKGRHHAGLVVVANRRTDLGVQIRALTRLATTLDPAAMRDRLELLSNWQA